MLSESYRSHQGFRVELDGVVAVMSGLKQVSAVACLLIGRELVAFLAPDTADVDQIKADMSTVLPYYAVPSRFERRAVLPLTR